MRSGLYRMVNTIAASKVTEPVQRPILLLTLIRLVSVFWVLISEIAFQQFQCDWRSSQRTRGGVARQQIAGWTSLDVNNTFPSWCRRGWVPVSRQTGSWELNRLVNRVREVNYIPYPLIEILAIVFEMTLPGLLRRV
jgi:hypothetical protein